MQILRKHIIALVLLAFSPILLAQQPDQATQQGASTVEPTTEANSANQQEVEEVDDDSFKPSEEILEDQAVSFPVDI